MKKETKKAILNIDKKETTEAGEIARFYGFKPIFSPSVSKKDYDAIKDINNSSDMEEKVAVFSIYFEEKMYSLSQPVMFYLERPFVGSKSRKKPNRIESTLITLGSYKSVCECLSIQSAISILNKLGYKDLEIRINSIGDRESVNEFNRKMSAFVKKNFNNFPQDLRQALKKDHMILFKENKEEWKKWLDESPKSIDFLSESSRAHFKECLEFLEIMEVPYSIDNNLLGNLDIGSETVFSIIDQGDKKTQKEPLAYGFRFNKLAKKMGFKKDIPSCFCDISAKLKKNMKKIKIKSGKNDFYLVQFGSEAKLKSFLVLKELLKAKVSVIHSIAKDKLSAQMSSAESSNSKYIILLGQKEAIENSVIIRDTATRAQEIVPIKNLYEKVSKLV